MSATRLSMDQIAQELRRRVEKATPDWAPAEGRCTAWAELGRELLREQGMEFDIVHGPALFTFGPGLFDGLNYSGADNSLHYWLTNTAARWLDFSLADLHAIREWRRTAHANMPMTKEAMRTRIPLYFDSNQHRALLLMSHKGRDRPKGFRAHYEPQEVVWLRGAGNSRAAA